MQSQDDFSECCVHVLSPTGYQGYKKHFRRGSDDADTEAPSLEGGPVKVKDLAVENSGFELDENDSSEEKNKDPGKNTAL